MRQTLAHARRHPARTRRGGFTLLEIMLVIVIIGVLSTVVVVSVSGSTARAKIAATKTSLRTIKNALEMYNGQYSSYPDDLSRLINTNFIDKSKNATRDSWGTEFIYRYPGTSNDPEHPYDLSSAGASKRPGAPDNIDIWTIDEEPVNAKP